MGKLSAGKAGPIQLHTLHGTSAIANLHHESQQTMALKGWQTLYVTWLSHFAGVDGFCREEGSSLSRAASSLPIDTQARFLDVDSKGPSI
jgi:hypothetical protein